ncbi:CHASE2 domain-containing protein [Paenibacillus tarimensis]|uniref:CHASE2 domain-containing protein n=1 Tax=Paenibacillus tarimensis TaxID=416012 RepID=UPI002E231433
MASLGSGGTLHGLETTLRDLLRKQSDFERRPLDQIKIIKIDQHSLDQLGGFPWDRSLYAELITKLAEAGAKAIALDVILSEPGSDPYADAAMAAVMKRYPNVFLPAVFEFEQSRGSEDSLETASVIYPAETISSNIDQTGHINVLLDRDSVVRRLTVGLENEEGLVIPSLSVRMANALLGPDEQIRWDPVRKSWYRGDERIPVNERSQITTEYYTEPQEEMTAVTGYDAQSFSDVIRGIVPAEYYAGSIVLIGAYAPGMQDGYLTPMSAHAKMYGVEIQANMIQSLVNGAFFTELPDMAVYWFIAAAVLISVLLFDRFRGWGTLVLFLTMVLLLAAVWMMAYMTASLFIPITYPFLALTSVMIWAVSAHYSAERRERTRVTEVFGRFVPPSVVSELLASGVDVKAGGQRRDVTIVFADIRGFTSMSERLQPEDVIQVLNEYLDICTRAVFACNGTLDKFIGDGVMAIFGAPAVLPNHTEQAVRAALQMKREAAALERRCIERFGLPVTFGIGIHSGPAVVGNVGSEALRLDYTAIGDTVNLAARLESAAKAGQIIVSREAAERLNGLFQLENLGEIKVKGKAGPVHIYRVAEKNGKGERAANEK